MFSGTVSMGSGSYSDTPLYSTYNKIQMSNIITSVLHIFKGIKNLSMQDNPEEYYNVWMSFDEENIENVNEVWKSFEQNDSFVIQDISEEWEEDTILLATFDNNLIAGNIYFDISDIRYIRIKRKLKTEPDNNYINIFECELDDSTANGFIIYDNYAKAKTEYTYGICYVTNSGLESAFIECDVLSDFCGIVLCDKDKLYYTELETEYSFTKNHNSSVVTTISNRHPYVIHNDIADYWTGQLSAMWADKDDFEYDLDSQFEFREGLYNWLNNGQSKILKLDDGREWIINITGTIQESENDHWQKVITSFDWTETGDCNSESDLRKNGLIKVTST